MSQLLQKHINHLTSNETHHFGRNPPMVIFKHQAKIYGYSDEAQDFDPP